MKELETRVMDIDVDDIRNKMKSLGAIKVKSEDQVNEIYDFEDGRLLANKGYARVRTTIDRLTGKETVFMTTKKMLSQGTFKVMEENETIVEDGEMARRIFKSLGLVLQESISKYRESYKLSDSLIEIDINDKSFFTNLMELSVSTIINDIHHRKYLESLNLPNPKEKAIIEINKNISFYYNKKM